MKHTVLIMNLNWRTAGCLDIICAGVYSGIAVPDWSLHIISIQWNGWNLWCSTDTPVHR